MAASGEVAIRGPAARARACGGGTAGTGDLAQRAAVLRHFVPGGTPGAVRSLGRPIGLPQHASMDRPDSPLAAIDAWIAAFNATDAARVVALYAPDAVLWGTLATTLITTREGLRAYFERALGGTPGPGVALQQVVVQSFDGLAVASGAYLLRLGDAGRRRVLPARFTLVLRSQGGAWSIVSHHSSAMPLADGATPAVGAGLHAEQA